YKAYSILCLGDKPKSTDPLIGIQFLINYDGELYNTNELILDLISLWQMFLTNHSSIDISFFSKVIDDYLRVKHIKDTIYSAPMPKGLLDDAKRLAIERTHIDI
ncbi:MAG: hypothetical protein ACE5DW_02690, partial [Thermodesulfobacteriota bacterium]